MPSNRRVKVFGLLIFISLITTLFYLRQDSSLSSPSGSDTEVADDFYQKTVHALDSNGNVNSNNNGKANAQAKLGGKDAEAEDDAGVRERLKKAADVAKGNANAKAPKPDPPSSIVGVGSAAEGSVAGRKTFPLKPKEGAAVVEPAEKKVETEEEHAVEVEMNTILKKSPIIIFSKSYCPHSKRAKTILLERYTIDPAPYVVELDLHPLGAQLQASLAEMTGRKTVPNVLINGKSIGGGDEVAGLDSDGKLISTVKSMGGKRMVEVSKKTETEAPKAKVAAAEKENDKAYEHESGLKRRSKIIRKKS